MSSRETQLPDLDALDAQSLKALVLAKQGEIESLKLLIVKLKRMHFGPSSEKQDRDIQQLELRLEELESSRRPPSRRRLHVANVFQSVATPVRNGLDH